MEICSILFLFEKLLYFKKKYLNEIVARTKFKLILNLINKIVRRTRYFLLRKMFDGNKMILFNSFIHFITKY